MNKDFILPDIGEGIVECELVEWLVEEGDFIEEDQPVVDVMTDKALVQIPAPEAGRVTKLYYQQGENAQVHAPLFAIELETEETSKPAHVATQQHEHALVNEHRNKKLASPAIRRLCREFELQIGEISGTGKDGRVLKEDVLRFKQALASRPEAGQQGEEQPAAEISANFPQAVAPAMTQAAIADGYQAIRPVPNKLERRSEALAGVRAIMAKQMALSASTIPQFAYGEELNVGPLLDLKEQLQAKAETQGIHLTLMAFFMKALAMAVQHYPILNSRLNQDCTEIHYQPHCNIGMAVDSPLGLIVPCVKNVENLSLLAIAAEVYRLTQAARSGHVERDDLRGATITISNVGTVGGTYTVPVINPPEVAIVAVGRIRPLPRFDHRGEVERQQIVNISWSGDHRIIDGGTMARFSGLWQSYLEDPSAMLLEL